MFWFAGAIDTNSAKASDSSLSAKPEKYFNQISISVLYVFISETRALIFPKKSFLVPIVYVNAY